MHLIQVRLVDNYGHIHRTWEITKARLKPRKFVSVPELELFAAVLAVNTPTKKN